MKNIRYFCFALLWFFICACFLLPGLSEAAPPLKKYYLTKDNYVGDEVLNACAKGYHMATLLEIRETSTLQYNTSLGFTHDDSGFGPPILVVGWIRTGYGSIGADVEGLSNCFTWTSGNVVDFGSLLGLKNDPSEPWLVGTITCSSAFPVWCVQN